MNDPLSPAGPHASLGNDDLPHRAAGISAFEAFKFGFTGPGVVGLLIGLVLFLIPIAGVIVLLGWVAETHRRLVRQELPAVRPFDTNSLGDYLKAGIVTFLPQLVVGFVISIPLSFVMVGGMLVAIPIVAATESAVLGLIAALLGFGVTFALTMASIVVVKAVQIRSELTGDLTASFDIPGITGLIKRQWGPMILHSVLLGLLCIPAMLLGMVAFFIGAYVVAVAIQFMLVHLRYQIYAQDVALGGEKLPVFEGGGANI